MALNKFHELNKAKNTEILKKVKKTVVDVLDIDRYFDEMEITEKQKEDRKAFAKRLEDKLLTVFALIEVMKERNITPDAIFIMTQIQNAFSEVMSDEVTVSDNLANYILIKSWKLADTTVKHIEDEFYLSMDRATLIAENETSSIFNCVDDEQAISNGCTKKTWHTIRDRKTRDWHKDVDGETIDIDDYFEVDGEFMAYPHDINSSDKNVANCRCSVSYS